MKSTLDHRWADRGRAGIGHLSAAAGSGIASFARAAEGFFFRQRSSSRCKTTKKAGTKTTARQVDAIMPVNTLIPRDLRELAPAPVASTSGNTPRIKAKDVIRIGRKRVRAASIAASKIGLPSKLRCSRATSTIKMPFFAESAINSINPI